jgi:hypothetical protein
MTGTTIAGGYTTSIALSNPATRNPFISNGHGLSGTYTATVTLATPATQNPATIIGTGRISAATGSAIYGTGAAFWTISNYGTVAGPARGIFLTAGGQITNAASGVVDGGSRGIDITGGPGAVANAGAIAGGTQQGIRLTGGGSVTNLSGGTITGGAGYAAIYIRRGGEVSNAAGGAIGPVQVYDSSGTVANAGSIVSYLASVDGVLLSAGGSLTNTTNALIGGVATIGVYLTTGTVANAGTIVGSQYAIEANGTGSVIITNSGMMGMLAGGATTVVTLANSGTLSAVSLHGTGSVTNAASGLIIGSNSLSPVLYFAHGGSLSNAGSISGGFVDVIKASGDFVVTNMPGGTVSGNYGGFDIDVAGGVGTVMNGGRLNGQSDIILRGGGLVSNASSGLITSILGNAVSASGAPATLINDGTIYAGVAAYGFTPAVYLDAGSVLINRGTIIGQDLNRPGIPAEVFINGTGTIINSGTIYALGESMSYVGSGYFVGVTIGGGSVTNVSGATMPHLVSTGPANIDNAGTFDAISIHGGVVTNEVGGTLTGGTIAEATYGVSVGNGTVINHGIIIGQPGVILKGGVLTNAAIGIVAAVTADAQSQVINAGLISGVVLNNGGFISNAAGAFLGGVTVASYGTSGATTYSTIINDGRITSVAFDVDASAVDTLVNAGTINTIQFGNGAAGLLVVEPGATITGTIDGGSVGSTMELAAGAGGTISGFAGFSSIIFDAGAEWTIAGNTTSLGGIISGFAPGNTIDLISLGETIAGYAAGTLTLGGDRTVELRLPGSFTTASFQAGPDGNVGTDIFLACFAAGTRIATARGDVAVEHLHIGDHALTSSRDNTLVALPIRWIGHRRIDLARHPRPDQVRPIRIRRGAFANDVPNRDLLLSPDHAIYAEGVLIPVRYLVNKRMIVADRHIRFIEYYHVELDRHAILIAEDMQVESYLDTGDRSFFGNGGKSIVLHPDFAIRTWEAAGCAPLVVAGAEVAAIRDRLARRGWKRRARVRAA